MTKKEMIQCALEKGFQDFEILEKEQQIATITVKNKSLNEYQIGDSRIFQLKGNYQNTIVKMTSTFLDETHLDELLQDAKQKENHDGDYFLSDCSYNCTYSKTEEFQPSIELPRLLKCSEIQDNYPEVYDTSLVYEEVITKLSLENSNGVSLEDGNHTYEFMIDCSARNEKETATTYRTIYSKTKENWDLESMIKTAMEEGKYRLDAHSIPSGNYPVIFQNNVLEQLFRSFLPMFSAENIQNGKSPLIGKQQEKIFSSNVTIVEDATNKDYCGYRKFDNEGTKTERKNIVKDGIFTQVLYNHKTAMKDHATSTGNSFGSISTRNAYFVPGTKNFEELRQLMNNGLVITSLSGLHCGINIQNGDFSLQVEGYLVKNGKQSDPVKLIAVAGNLFQMLNQVVEFGSDLEFHSDCFGSPSLYIKELQISGTESL